MQVDHHHNKTRLDKTSEAAEAVCVENLSRWTEAIEEISTWSEYEPQPMHLLPHQAERLGIDKLFFKDESKRFGASLGSFKALGAPHAVFRILADQVFFETGVKPTSDDLRTGKYKDITKMVTICVATDGNQGRGLAYGAKIFGCRFLDYIHSHVSPGRAESMKALGATVIRIDGEYEASHFVSSTSWTDFDEEIPQNVMNAYMVVVEEALQAIPVVGDVTHVFACGGVGSIAAAVFLGFFTRLSEIQQSNQGRVLVPPRFVVVEPKEADCLFQSVKKGGMCLSGGSLRALMAGLACRCPSPAAWKILSWFASDFVTVPDEVAIEGMRELASGGGDVPIVCGESSAATMGVMLETASDETVRGKLGLDSDSQVVLFGLEGATDPTIYESLVGKTPEEVFAAQERFFKA